MISRALGCEEVFLAWDLLAMVHRCLGWLFMERGRFPVASKKDLAERPIFHNLSPPYGKDFMA